MENTRFPDASPFSPIIEDSGGEKGLNRLLEKQIEDITNLAVAPKGMSDAMLLGVKVHVKQELQSKTVDVSALNIQNVIAPHDKNHMKRSTRSSKRLQVEMQVVDHPSPAPFMQENLSENTSHLTPLAARAALASLMSTTHNKHAAIEETRLFDCSISDNMTKKMKLSSRLSDAPVSESVKLVNPVIPIKGEASHLVELSSSILAEDPKTENNTSELVKSGASLTCSMRERKLSQSTKTTRITRAAAQRDAELTNTDIHDKTCDEAMESGASTSLRRLTRSAVNKVKEKLFQKDKQDSEENNTALDTQTSSSEGKITAAINIRTNEGRRKETSTAVETPQNIEGMASNNGTSSKGQKRKSISSQKKEERRFSPRLKSLSQTLAENKSS